MCKEPDSPDIETLEAAVLKGPAHRGAPGP